jgi:hypothetical protein
MADEKHAGGRPPMFESPDLINSAIAGYFEYIKGEFIAGPYKDSDPVMVRPPEPPTITGLALYLGFASRQSFYDYEKDGEFSYVIKRARLRIETEYEKRLMGNNPAGAIFALKNFGWSDKQEIDQKTEHSGTVGFTGINIIKPNDPSTE